MTNLFAGAVRYVLAPIAAISWPIFACAQSCTVQAVNYRGWKAQQVANEWVRLTIVPQLGGRLMQVEFEGHPYLFVNPRYEGKYVAPEEAAGRWINYGGDKIWPMPEGNRDEGHWVLESATLDDRPYDFSVLEQGARCTVQLAGPADDVTGLQYTRQISLGAQSPAIHFHALMHNATSHTLRWSVQSVSQYNLADAKTPNTWNHDFHAFTAANSDSAYPGGFHVRAGLADDPSFHVRDGLFHLHWIYFENEVWIDSHEGWLAVADGQSGFGMIERFSYDPAATYPDKTTVIFYKNGPSVEFDENGTAKLSEHNASDTPYYMEAEVNSPLVTLTPGASTALDTVWYPLRTGADVKHVTEAGIVTQPLQAVLQAKKLKVDGAFSVVVPGHLQLRIYDAGGRDRQNISLDEVGPQTPVTLSREFSVDYPVSRVSLHLIDRQGGDWGSLDTTELPQQTAEDQQ